MINSHEKFILVEEVDGRTFSISISISPTAKPLVGWGFGAAGLGRQLPKVPVVPCRALGTIPFFFLPPGAVAVEPPDPTSQVKQSSLGHFALT